MSMFFRITADGWLNKRGETPSGLTTFSTPEVFTKTEITQYLEEMPEQPKVDLDKSSCPQIQVIDTWKSDGYYYEELIIKAMGYQQAEDLAIEYGKTKAPGYFERKQALDNYKQQIAKTKEAAKKVVGYGYKGDNNYALSL